MDLIVSPTVVALNTQSGASKLAQAAAQLIDGLVLQVIDAATVRLQVGNNVIDVKTDVPLDPGTQVKLAARGQGDDFRWVIVGAASAATSGRGVDAARPAAQAAPYERPVTEFESGALQVQNPAVQGLTRSQIGSATQPAPQADVNAAIEFVNATRTAAARQGGLAPVFAELNALVSSPGAPAAVRAAAAQVLRAPVTLDQPSADIMRQAVTRSGLFFEARIAADVRPAVTASAQSPIAPGDLKAALFTLRQALQSWLVTLPAHADAGKSDAGAEVNGAARSASSSSPAQSSANLKAPAPPYRGAPTAGQQPVGVVAVGLSTVLDIARSLLDHTDSAIARQVLMQVASVPDSGHALSQANGTQAHWSLEVPFVTPQGTAVAQFEIERDGHQASAPDAPRAPWRANFSIDVEPLGPVHAQIALTGKRTAVRLWAERTETAAALRFGLADLAGALRAAELEAGDVIVRDGAPPRAAAPKPGRFLDRAS